MAVRRPAAQRAREGAEERLLVEAAQKDPARFAELYDIHFERVYVFIARRVRNRDTAEDLTSDVFHRALANLGTYEWRGAPFAAWLIRIAANAVADQAKRSARELTAVDDAVEPGETPDLESLAARARLFQLVDQLPDRQRRVIFDRFVEQKTVHEIAMALGRSDAAVKQLQFRALQSLRAKMETPRA